MSSKTENKNNSIAVRCVYYAIAPLAFERTDFHYINRIGGRERIKELLKEDLNTDEIKIWADWQAISGDLSVSLEALKEKVYGNEQATTAE